MAGGSYYAVAVGRKVGIFSDWNTTESMVKGYPSSRYKKFNTIDEAHEFIAQNSLNNQGSISNSVSDNFVINSTLHLKRTFLCEEEAAFTMGNSSSSNRKKLLAPVQTPSKFFSKLPISPKRAVHVEHAVKRPKLYTSKKVSTDIYYTVFGGNGAPGIYMSWEAVEAETFGIEAPVIHKFSTRLDAQAHLDTFIPPSKKEPIGKFYAVLRGRKPGIYKTLADAQEQISGFSSIRKFDTLLEAQNHFNEISRKLHSKSDPDPQDPNTLVAFCDGSAFGNGKKSCKAGFATVFPHNESWNIMKKLNGISQTNNRAEYWSAIEALKRANKEDPLKVRELFIFSDSMLLIKSMTEWIDGWLKSNWVKSDGKTVENVDLLKILRRESHGRRVIWRHVKAHTKKKDWESFWNNRVDEMAKDAANGRELFPLN